MNCSYKILILYAEVMDYLLAAISQFKIDHPRSEIVLFELDKKKKTNFSFNSNDFIYHKKSDFDSYERFKKICVDFNPDIILVSGRMHQHYLKIARLFKNCNKITVTLQDTKYERSLRQHIIRLFSKFLYHRYFNVFWGAGDPQYAFALSIGYSAENIFTGIYTANDKVFAKPQSSYEKKRSSDRNILFVGRLSKEKNILKLASVLEEINKEYNSKHKLYIYGDGSLGPALSAFSCVEITPFSNSKSIAESRSKFDFFCLPSIVEPWGVVVHEFGLLGMPLLLSSEVGARCEFLIDSYNGYTFNPKDSESMKSILVKALKMSDVEIDIFGERSSVIAIKISRSIWSATLNAICSKIKSDS